MRIILEFTLLPLGVDASLSPSIAACQDVLAQAGLSYELHPNGTGVEGEWDDVFGALKRCHEVVHEMGAARIHTTMQVGSRTDRAQSMADKAASVRMKLAE